MTTMLGGMPSLLPVIAIDRKAPAPLHRQIYDAYRALIVARSLRPGQQIPSTRALATELGISRIPAINAYAQLLTEGYFETRKGAGTFVSSSLLDQPAVEPPRTRPAERRQSPLTPSNRAPWSYGPGPFTVGQLTFDHFPLNAWDTLVTRHSRKIRAASLNYGDPMGLRGFREAVAGYLRTSRSVRCEADQVMVVSGSQQALDISARVLLDPASRVWIEDPGYPLLRAALALGRCRVIPVPVDSEGLDVAEGIRRCRGARAAFVTPSHQFPLGVTMSASRRLQLLGWAQSKSAWVIEDDYDSEFRYENMPIASLQGLDSSSRVIYIGTFSKTLFPSVRLGYIVIPRELVDRFAAVRHSMDLFPPFLYQAVLTDFINEGHFARHIRKTRLLYSQRRNALIEALDAEFGSSVRIVGAQAGMHLVVTLPDGMRDTEISARAVKQNLWLWPLSPCYLGKAPRQGFILGFVGTEAEAMRSAVKRLRAVLTPG